MYTALRSIVSFRTTNGDCVQRIVTYSSVLCASGVTPGDIEMPRDDWFRARQRDMANEAARQYASGEPSTFDRIDDDPDDKVVYLGVVATTGRKQKDKKQARACGVGHSRREEGKTPKESSASHKGEKRLRTRLRKKVAGRRWLELVVAEQRHRNEHLSTIATDCAKGTSQGSAERLQLRQQLTSAVKELRDEYTRAIRLLGEIDSAIMNRLRRRRVTRNKPNASRRRVRHR